MKLLTKTLERRFAEIGSQADEQDPLVIAKFFSPVGNSSWYATEYDAGDKSFYGYVSIFGRSYEEWGRFSLEQLESYKKPFGLGIERDREFVEKRASEAILLF